MITRISKQLEATGSYCPERCGEYHSSRSTAEARTGRSSAPGWYSSAWALVPGTLWALQAERSGDNIDDMNTGTDKHTQIKVT